MIKVVDVSDPTSMTEIGSLDVASNLATYCTVSDCIYHVASAWGSRHPNDGPAHTERVDADVTPDDSRLEVEWTGFVDAEYELRAYEAGVGACDEWETLPLLDMGLSTNHTFTRTPSGGGNCAWESTTASQTPGPWPPSGPEASITVPCRWYGS